MAKKKKKKKKASSAGRGASAIKYARDTKAIRTKPKATQASGKGGKK